jgi:hypothetical protein
MEEYDRKIRKILDHLYQSIPVKLCHKFIGSFNDLPTNSRLLNVTRPNSVIYQETQGI